MSAPLINDLVYLCVSKSSNTHGFLKNTLDDPEITILIADSIPSAKKIIEQNYERIVAVICDYELNGQSGSAVELRRSTLTFKNIPFVALSGEVSVEELLQAINNGISTFIKAPYSSENFLSTLRPLVNERLGFLEDIQLREKIFFEDAKFIIEDIDLELKKLNFNHHKSGVIYNCYRLVHSLKISSTTLNRAFINSFCSRLENYLGELRISETEINEIQLQVVEEAICFLKKLIDAEHEKVEIETPDDIFNESNYKPKEISLKSEKSQNKIDQKRLHNKRGKITKVDLRSLEKMAHFSAESTIQKNIIAKLLNNLHKKYPIESHLSELSEHFWELAKLQSSLQDEITDVRSTPFIDVCQPLQSLSRDLNQFLKKKVALIIEDDDVGLDPLSTKTLEDSLPHLVRNAFDHGFETLEERISSGKSKQGQLTIASSENSIFYFIKITDDGKGIDKNRVLSKAKEKGLIPNDVPTELSPEEIYQLIFAPGFSTAASITGVSGAGTGLDSVKKMIEDSGGYIDINSEFGKGTQITLALKKPDLSVSHESLLVGVSGLSLAIPQAKVLRLLHVDESIKKNIFFQQGATSLLLENNLIPLFHLKKMLAGKKEIGVSEVDFVGENHMVFVKDEKDQKFIILVDEVFDIEELVIRGLPPFVCSLGVFKGAALLGSSNLGLVLDVDRIGKIFWQMQNKLDVSMKKAHATETIEHSNYKPDAKLNLVMFSTLRFGALAIEYKYLYRIDKFLSGALKKIGQQKVLIYQKNPMIVTSLDDVVAEKLKTHIGIGQETDGLGEEKSEDVIILMLRYENNIFAYQVSKIIDIADINLSQFIPGNKSRPLFKSFFYHNDILISLLDENLLVSDLSTKKPGESNKQKVA